MSLVGKFGKHLREGGVKDAFSTFANWARDKFEEKPPWGPFGEAPEPCDVPEAAPWGERPDGSARILVQAHIFFPEDADEIARSLNCIPYRFDVLVSTDTEKKRKQIEAVFSQMLAARSFTVEVLPNHGRDVLPFLTQVRRCWQGYDYLCHIHSKHSGTVTWGDAWRRYLYRSLFGSQRNVAALLGAFETDPGLGLWIPERYPMIVNDYARGWKRYAKSVSKLLRRMGLDGSVAFSGDPTYPAGTMFWARMDAVRQIFETGEPAPNRFATEGGQVGYTVAHDVERVWSYLAAANGYRTAKIALYPRSAREDVTAGAVAVFVAFSPEGRLDESDLRYLAALRTVAERVVLVSNGPLSEQGREQAGTVCDDIIERPNEGYDFGAWKDALLALRPELADATRLFLVNNSCYAPVSPLSGMVEELATGAGAADFWGVSSYPGSFGYRRHLQSYFLAFEQQVLRSEAFWSFWTSFEPVSDRDAAIESGESVLTGALEDAGFSWRCFCPDAEVFAEVISNTQGYIFPYEMLAVGNPLIKKKCAQMAVREQLAGAVRVLEQLDWPHPALADLVRGEAVAKTTDELLERNR